jgi:biopolymer transport protein ExbD
MKIPPRPRPEVRINLSPLIDVIFILLIFVFLVARFIDQERMDVDIPTSTQGKSEQQLALVLYLDKDGGLRFEGAPLARDKLRATLQQRRGAYKDMLLIVDRSLSVQSAVDVLTVARESGYEDVGLATQEPAKP